MSMTLEQWNINPGGKGNSTMSAIARESVRNEYIKKYSALLVREHGLIRYKLYKNKDNTVFYAYFMIPSETVRNFYYDIVFKFTANETSGDNLLKYDVQFFANDPAFIYTYAYVFNKEDLLVPELRSKISSKALKEKPDQTNPYKQVSYTKTIYFAYLFMVQKNLQKLDRFTVEASNFSASYLKSMVQDADSKISARQSAGEKLRKSKARQKKEDTQNSSTSKGSNVIKPIKTTGKVSTVKNNKNFVKKTKIK